jgi:hypothetical protein
VVGYIGHPGNRPISERLSNLLNEEEQSGTNTLERYHEFALAALVAKEKTVAWVDHEIEKGKIVYGLGAPVKGNTLLNSCKINTDIMDYIADETPEKIGKFSPTTGIPIVNKQAIVDKPTDYIVILAWNFQEEIIAKLRPIYKGKFIIPVPELKIID